ncbi:MAG: M14 family metallopeptidase, partial [Ignavibacteria bacterium]|nr:M14 family metallopeptidase [Ignavibacteria bacterium]
MKIKLIFCVFLLNQFLLAQNIKTPEQFLGFKVGADYKIADYETIQKYFKHLAENSKRIIYREIGKTSQNRDMFMAIISTEENLANLEKYRAIVKKLSDPRKINDEEANQLIEDGKVVVLVTCNIHSTEIASSQMSMELAYNLISNSKSDKTVKALENVIFILMPSINPDGTTMVVNWYNKYLNTEYDGAPMPYLYHIYSGHDNNRDWFMFNLPETRNVIDIAYHQWYPQIWLDEHQMGSNGARLFVVPYKDPINPNVNPLIWRWQKVIGGLTSLHLEQKGFTGIIDQAIFEGWWEGPASDCGLWHNQIALLSEMASCNIASPIYIDPSEVRATSEITVYDIRTNYPNPWRGGWWRLRDIVDYELALTSSLIEVASDYKKDLLSNYYEMCKSAVEKGKKGNPFAFIIPRNQNDPVTTAKMIEI